VAEPVKRDRMTVEEFVAWEGEPDVRYELVDGVAVTMNPPMTFHAAIVVTVGGELNARLRRRRPCRALNGVGV
jgi:Uma2 family endonuclease